MAVRQQTIINNTFKNKKKTIKTIKTSTGRRDRHTINLHFVLKKKVLHN